MPPKYHAGITNVSFFINAVPNGTYLRPTTVIPAQAGIHRGTDTGDFMGAGTSPA